MLVVSMATELVLRLLAPPRCAACDQSLPHDSIFCAACAATVVLLPRAYTDAAIAAAVYGGAVAAAIVRFKYSGRTDLARPLAHLMLPLTAKLAVDVVVPVPLHGDRLRERGYNQAALLARPVAERLRRPFAPLALGRLRETAAQASLSACERRSNVADAFSVRQPRAVAGKRVLLVDDVRTTGATLAACATPLVAAGAKHVHFLTVAQA